MNPIGDISKTLADIKDMTVADVLDEAADIVDSRRPVMHPTIGDLRAASPTGAIAMTVGLPRDWAGLVLAHATVVAGMRSCAADLRQREAT